MRIQPIRSQVIPQQLPSVHVPLNVGTGFGQGLGAMAEAGGQLSDVMASVERRKKEFEDATALTGLTAEAKVNLAKFENDINIADYTKIPELKKQGLERISKEMADKAAAINPEVAANWSNRVWPTLQSQAVIDTSRIEIEKFRQHTIAGVLQFMNLMEDEAVKATLSGDKGRVAAINQSVTGWIDKIQRELNVTGHQAETWKESYQNGIESKVTLEVNRYKQQLRDQEAKADKEKKIEMENNFGDLVDMYSRGQLTEAYIRGQITLRKVDPDKALSMINRLRSDAKEGAEAVKNNPVVVGQIAEGLELGLDVEDNVDAALKNGQINTATYISMKGKLGDREFKRGLYYINRALQPAPADKWTPDRNVRHAEAIDDYQDRVANGGDPVKVAREIVDLNIGHIRRTISGIRAPRFLVGDKMDIQDVEAAKAKTVEQFKRGAITVEEFQRESEIFKEIGQLIDELGTTEKVDEEMSGRMKQSEKLRKQ